MSERGVAITFGIISMACWFATYLFFQNLILAQTIGEIIGWAIAFLFVAVAAISVSIFTAALALS